MSSSFANPDRVTEGWYVLDRSRRIRPGRIHTFGIGKRDVVAYRAADGGVVALDALCPHLGAHLSQGKLDDGGVRCAFHGWRWSADGGCTDAPGYDALPKRRTRRYPTSERWGFTWVWLGAREPYPLPEVEAGPDARIIRPPPRIVRCHPHMMIGNGHDIGHFSALHGFTVERAPDATLHGDHALSLDMEGRIPREGFVKWLGLGGAKFRSTYTTLGGSIVHLKVHEPLEFEVVFTGRPTAEGHTRAQTLAFIPSFLSLPRVLAVVAGTTAQDIPLLESVRFQPGYDAGDDAFVRYAKLVEGLPTW